MTVEIKIKNQRARTEQARDKDRREQRGDWGAEEESRYHKSEWYLT